MPSPLVHIAITAPLSLGYKRLNILSLFIASLFPDLLALLISPILIFVFGLRGEKLNWFFTFFDQSILGGLIGIIVLTGIILGFIKLFPRLSTPFKWKQNYSAQAISLSVVLGVALHILLDNIV